MPTLARRIVGLLLLLCGLLWFLPILGLWMIPLGLLILSADFDWARRGHLSLSLWLKRARRLRRVKRRQKTQRLSRG